MRFRENNFQSILIGKNSRQNSQKRRRRPTIEKRLGTLWKRRKTQNFTSIKTLPNVVLRHNTLHSKLTISISFLFKNPNIFPKKIYHLVPQKKVKHKISTRILIKYIISLLCTTCKTIKYLILFYLYFTPKKLCVEMSLFSVFAYIFFVQTFFRGRKGIIMNSFVTKRCREVFFFILQLLLDNFLNCTIGRTNPSMKSKNSRYKDPVQHRVIFNQKSAYIIIMLLLFWCMVSLKKSSTKKSRVCYN